MRFLSVLFLMFSVACAKSHHEKDMYQFAGKWVWTADYCTPTTKPESCTPVQVPANVCSGVNSFSEMNINYDGTELLQGGINHTIVTDGNLIHFDINHGTIRVDFSQYSDKEILVDFGGACILKFRRQ